MEKILFFAAVKSRTYLYRHIVNAKKSDHIPRLESPTEYLDNGLFSYFISIIANRLRKNPQSFILLYEHFYGFSGYRTQ